MQPRKIYASARTTHRFDYLLDVDTVGGALDGLVRRTW